MPMVLKLKILRGGDFCTGKHKGERTFFKEGVNVKLSLKINIK